MVNIAPVYQLFITNSDGITTSNVTSNDYIDLSLQLDSEYNITLVATGEDLPSDTLTVTVPQGIVIFIIIIINVFCTVVSAVVEGPAIMPQNLSSTFEMFCTVTLINELSGVVVNTNWISPDGYAFNSTTNGDIVLTSLTPVMTSVNNSVVYTHTLRVNTFQASHVGEYTCRVMINDSIVTRKLAASVRGKDYPLLILPCIHFLQLALVV